MFCPRARDRFKLPHKHGAAAAANIPGATTHIPADSLPTHMQKQLCCLLIALCAPGFSSAGAPAHSGQIAAWNFDKGKSADALSGLPGAPANPDAPSPLRDNALVLDNAGKTDAQGQAFLVADAPLLTGHDGKGAGFTSLVIEADVQPASLGTQAQIVRKTDDELGYQVYVREDGKVVFQIKTRENLLRMASKNALKADGKWHHIEAVWDRDVWTYNAILTVDGVVSWASAKDLGPLDDTQGPLQIGGYFRAPGDIGQRFDGRIENVRLSVNRPELFKISGRGNPDIGAATGAHLAGQPGFLGAEFVYDFDATPECHAGTLAQRADGAVAAAWFGGTREGHQDVGVWQSVLEGGQWSAPRQIAHARNGNQTLSPTFNPVLFQIPGGDLLLFYMGDQFQTHFIARSPDGGQTWGAPEILPTGVHGASKNKPVLLQDGTLLCPDNGRTGMRFNRTKDFGKTWLPSVQTPPNDIDAIQPSVLTHPDGRLQALGRSHTGAIVQSWSSDGGQTWSPLEKTSLPNNYSGIDALTLRDGRHLLIYNHTGIPKGRWGGARTPLNVAISDDGVTWYAALVLEDEPGEFSYPVVIQAKDGTVHALYTWNRLRMKHATIDPSKLVLHAIKDGVWPAEATVPKAAATPQAPAKKEAAPAATQIDG